ncbi:MAG: hypothetical protein ACREQP_22145, partial [Candidatus Binatia bacterium]
LPLKLQQAFASPDISTVLWKSALVIYFFSWVFGANSDTEMQSEVYLAAPHEGRMTKEDVGVMLGIVAGFVVLCIAGNNHRWFALALTGFWTINVLAWRYMVGALKTPIRQSYVKYGRAKQYVEMEKLRAVEHYATGRWQWWRFAAGALLAAAMNVFAFVEVGPGYAEASIFFFVIFVEAWIWIMRQKTKLALRVLDDLTDHYGDKLAQRGA